MKKWKLIVIEWIDWSWKWTQTELVKEQLELQWFKVWILDFPRYNEESSYFVRRYLNWKYSNITIKQACLFYALDRFDMKDEIYKMQEECDFIISNRYTTSNMVHQWWKDLSKIRYIHWMIDEMEYIELWIPRPNKVLFLNVNPSTSRMLIKQKEQRNYIEDWSNKDIHEADEEHLTNAFNAWKYIAEELDDDWKLLNCYWETWLLKKEEITKIILEEILND